MASDLDWTETTSLLQEGIESNFYHITGSTVIPGADGLILCMHFFIYVNAYTNKAYLARAYAQRPGK